MTWLVWLPLFGAAASGTTLAITYYLHWGFRFSRPRLGMTAEISFLLFILCLGLSVIGHLLSNPPS